MGQINIQKASLQGFAFSCGPKRGDGGSIVIADFIAPWSEDNRAAGEWDDVPQTVVGNIGLKPGTLAAKNIEFKPHGKPGFELEVTEATSFKVFIPTKEDDDPELRFSVASTSKYASEILSKFALAWGKIPGTLKLFHDADAQGTLKAPEEGK